MKKLVYILTVILLLLVFSVSAFMIGSYIVESREQAEKSSSLSDLKNSIKETLPEVPQTPEETEPVGTFSEASYRDENGMLAEYGKIYAENKDLVGWLRIDGTKLDEPVMQTPDNPNFYLKHDFYGEYSDWGAVYAREECNINDPSDNITLYGHNMKDGSRFAALNDYVHRETWEYNPLIFFDTLYEYRTYKIFAVFTTTANLGEGFSYHQMIDAENKADFDKFIDTCKELSLYETNITPEYGDQIICLSTCEYSHDNGRLVVAAMRIS